MLRRLASVIVRRPWWVLAATLVFLLLAGFFGSGVQSRLKSGGFDDPKSDSAQAQHLLDEHFATAPSTADLVLLVRARTGDVDTPAVAAAGEQLTRDVAAEPDLAGVTSYWATKGPDLKSGDGRSALVLAHVTGGQEKAAKRAREVADKLAARSGPLQVRAGGQSGLVSDINTHVEADLKLAESIAVPATLVLLVVAFGSVVAAFLPLVIGLVSIVSTLLVLFVLSTVTDASLYALNVATAFGLGLAIDFGLLMVSRYREERDAGFDDRQAVVEAVAKAGRTIMFSAATVSVAMCGLLVFPVYFLRSIAVAAMAVVLVAALSAVVVLPALLALLRHRIDALALFRRRNGLATDSPFWRGAAEFVMRRPVRTALPVIVVLLALGIPFLHAKFAPPDERALPTGSVSREVSEVLGTEFPADNAKATTVVTAEGGSALDGVARQISRLPNVSRVDGASGSYVHGSLVAPAGPQTAQFAADRAGFLLVRPSVDPQSGAAQDVVKTIRALPRPPGTDLKIGGPTAALIDSKSAIGDHVWLALALMACATFVLLFLFTGSVVLPLKALFLNIFMLTAVLGTMTLVFQDGHLIRWLGTTPTPMNIAMVVLLCTISFGLSVDYEMFLLSRIKEAHDAGASTTDACVVGLGRVGRIVSTAAALLTVTLFSFATGLSFLQMFGLGTGLAVLLDATLVRGVLVPAFMRVAGEVNWWAPRPLRLLHARIGLHETPTAPPPAVPVDPAASLGEPSSDTPSPVPRRYITVSSYVLDKPRSLPPRPGPAPERSRLPAARPTVPRPDATPLSTNGARRVDATPPPADGAHREPVPAPMPADRVALAYRLLAEHRYDDSERLFTSLAADPEFAAESHYRLGMIRAARHDLTGAITELQRCIARHPTHVDALDLLRTIAEEYAVRQPSADPVERPGEPDQPRPRPDPGPGADPARTPVDGGHRDARAARGPGVGETRRDLPRYLRLLR